MPVENTISVDRDSHLSPRQLDTRPRGPVFATRVGFHCNHRCKSGKLMLTAGTAAWHTPKTNRFSNGYQTRKSPEGRNATPTDVVRKALKLMKRIIFLAAASKWQCCVTGEVRHLRHVRLIHGAQTPVGAPAHVADSRFERDPISSTRPSSPCIGQRPTALAHPPKLPRTL